MIIKRFLSSFLLSCLIIQYFLNKIVPVIVLFICFKLQPLFVAQLFGPILINEAYFFGKTFNEPLSNLEQIFRPYSVMF